MAARYYAPLLSFFRKRAGHPADAQDLVQQVFLSLSRNPRVTDLQNPDAYIFQTASNAWRDHLRRRVVRGNEVEIREENGGTGADFSPERLLLGQEAMAQVVAVLRKLPERTRDVFMLRCFEGLKYAEIAQLYGISIRAVEKHSARALAQVSHVLEQVSDARDE